MNNRTNRTDKTIEDNKINKTNIENESNSLLYNIINNIVHIQNNLKTELNIFSNQFNITYKTFEIKLPLTWFYYP